MAERFSELATPEISVDTVGTCDGGLSSNCAHDCPMDYELTVTPAEVDPDALSYLLIERRDGYSRVVDVPMSEEPFAFAPTAPEVPDNCFRVRQVDGAQNYSDWSPWRCPEGEASKPESGACGGCETSAGNRAGSALTLLLGVINLLLTRSRVGRSPRS